MIIELLALLVAEGLGGMAKKDTNEEEQPKEKEVDSSTYDYREVMD